MTYTAPKIKSSAPGSAPFSFTVPSTGTIPVLVHVSVTYRRPCRSRTSWAHRPM